MTGSATFSGENITVIKLAFPALPAKPERKRMMAFQMESMWTT